LSLMTRRLKRKGSRPPRKIVERVRQNEAYQDVPIHICIFKNAPKDHLAGGSYILETECREGTTLGEWTDYDRQYVLFGADEVPNEEDEQAFFRFRDEIKGFFSELSGVSAIGEYDGQQLIGLEITVNCQFDGYSEMVAFCPGNYRKCQ